MKNILTALVFTAVLFSVNATADSLKPYSKSSDSKKDVGELSLSEQIIILRRRFIEEKKVNEWPTIGTRKPGVFVVELTPVECNLLGGNIKVTMDCGHPYMSCTTTTIAPNGEIKSNSMCINEVDKKK